MLMDNVTDHLSSNYCALKKGRYIFPLLSYILISGICPDFLPRVRVGWVGPNWVGPIGFFLKKNQIWKKPTIWSWWSIGFFQKNKKKNIHLKKPTILSTFGFFQFSKIFVRKANKKIKSMLMQLKFYFLVLQTTNFVWKMIKKKYKWFQGSTLEASN